MISSFYGECSENEICVNGRGRSQLRNETTDVAHCVKLIAYTDIISATTPNELGKALGNVNLDASLSGIDQKTPLKADAFIVKASVSALGGAKGSTQKTSCVGCLELMSYKFASRTDVLELEVKLLATGVAAGILWLTMLSG